MRTKTEGVKGIKASTGISVLSPLFTAAQGSSTRVPLQLIC